MMTQYEVLGPAAILAFGYTQESLSEIQRYFTAEHKVIQPLTVREILDEQIATKLA